MNATTVSINQQGRQIATALRKKLPTYQIMAMPNNEWACFIDNVHCGGFDYQGDWVWVPPEESTRLGCPANWRDEVRTAVGSAIRECTN